MYAGVQELVIAYLGAIGGEDLAGPQELQISYTIVSDFDGSAWGDFWYTDEPRRLSYTEAWGLWVQCGNQGIMALS